ncbi:MAG TPA: VWA domain-containing protein [candidate division Zixibacteria bacterium]|nr:VWA domain-containing protein [candidate division Zixibacteria bacterium]
MKRLTTTSFAFALVALSTTAWSQITLDFEPLQPVAPPPTVTAQFTSPGNGTVVTSDTWPTSQQICGTVTANGSSGESCIMLVLDVSGSMSAGISGGASRLEQLQTAVKKMLGDLNPASARVGIVQFGHDQYGNVGASLVADMTSDFASLETAVDGLYPSGLTPTGDGMQIALSQLEKYCPPGASKYQVVASDGYWNLGVDPETVAGAAHNSFGQTVHTIGISADHNVSKMQAIAAAGGGQYFDATNLANLDSIFTASGGFVGIDSALLNGVDITSELNAFGQFCVNRDIFEGQNDFFLEGFAGEGYGSANLTIYGETRDPQPAIPEPSTAALVGLGLAGLALSARRRRR